MRPKFINPAIDWAGKTPPSRKWLWADLIPAGRLTLLSGAGGVGKSLLAQQLATAVATGTPLFGHDVTEGGVVAVFAEDDEAELHRRQANIAASILEDMENLDRLQFLPAGTSDLLLWNSQGKPTEFFADLATAIRERKPGPPALVILDNAAAIFGANEIDRAAVTQFCQMLERLICFPTGAAVLLLSHPSRAGAASGDGTSGSTAWNAAVRSRLYLTAGTEGDNDARTLETMKANYARAGGTIPLRWSDGALALDPQRTDSAAREDEIDGDVLAATVKILGRGESLSPKDNQKNFAPKAIKREASASRWPMAAIEASYRRLLDRGSLVIEKAGPRKGHQVDRVFVAKHVPETMGGVSACPVTH